MATEVAEDAFLDDRLHVGDAIGRQVMGLVKRDLAVVGLAEHAVEDDEVVLRVDVERRADAHAYGLARQLLTRHLARMADADPIQRLNAALEGRYGIERELGAGGMATVYLAEDLRHRRKVALKVLKPALAAVVGSERFLTEIRTTANLQHPHILPLFDSGEADGFLYYVMPFVDGETLGARLDREGQLSVEHAVALARKVARALDHAHRHGVVHRDVKPGNILLGEQAEPLVADFGIALALANAGGNRLTETGLSLGTPHYMAPEQATGDGTVDPRADVYALGCVLYEMLAGEPPFTGPTARAILVKVLTEDAPDVTRLRRTVPSNVASAVARSLEKLPADRFETAEHFVSALSDPGFHFPRPSIVTKGQEAGESARDGATRSSPRAALLPAIATLALLALGLAAWGWMRPIPRPAPTTRAAVDVGDLPAFLPLGEILVSPDGESLAIVGLEGRPPIHWRPAEADQFLPLAGTDGAEYAAFSPDGHALVFTTLTSGLVQRIDLAGGAPRTVAQLPTPDLGGIDWGDDDTVVFAGPEGVGLFRVPASGGVPVRILPDSVLLRNPEILPGGRAVLYTDQEALGTRIVDLETSAVRTVRAGALDARYVDTGHMLYSDAAGTLWAVAFEPGRGETRGEAVALFGGLSRPGVHRARFAVSRTGTLVYAAGPVRMSSGPRYTATIVRFDGTDRPLDIDPPPAGSGFDVSPDGTSLLYTVPAPGDRGFHIWLYNLELETAPRQLTFTGGNRYPVFSRDGEHVVFSSVREGTDGPDLFVKPLNDDTPPRLLFTHPGPQAATDWPWDSLMAIESGQPSALWLLDLSEPTDPDLREYLRPEEGDLWSMEVSPDRTLALYEEERPGTAHVDIRSFPVPGAPTRVSGEAGGFSPRWSSDGETVYYWALTGTPEVAFTAARIARDPTPVVVSRQTLFTGRGSGFALLPDDAGLIMMREAETSDAPEPERLVVVTNWFRELEARMGR